MKIKERLIENGCLEIVPFGDAANVGVHPIRTNQNRILDGVVTIKRHVLTGDLGSGIVARARGEVPGRRAARGSLLWIDHVRDVVERVLMVDARIQEHLTTGFGTSSRRAGR